MTEFVSLDRGDGRAAGCSGSTRGAEGDTFKYEELFAANALLLGRVTYQGFAQAWPSMGHDDSEQSKIRYRIFSDLVALFDRRRGGSVPRGQPDRLDGGATANLPARDTSAGGKTSDGKVSVMPRSAAS